MESYFENWVEDINIMVWNLHSSDAQGGRQRGERLADDRLPSIRYILESTKRVINSPLFLCCQERITDKKHELICNALGLDPAMIGNKGKEGQEVNVYYWNVSPQQVDYIVTDGEDEKVLWQQAGRASEQSGIGRFLLRGPAPTPSSQDNIGQAGDQVDAAIPSTSQSVPKSSNKDDRFLTRLRACVFHPGPGTSKLLIVSWHGPQLGKRNETPKLIKEPEIGKAPKSKNAGIMRIGVKERVFGKLLLFAELLRDRHDCQLAIIGGDFNLPDTIAKQRIKQLGIKARVYSDYKQPKDKLSPKIQEFMIVLPKAGLEFEVAETSVHHQYYKRERPRMLDHPIVRFRLTVSPNLNSEQPALAMKEEEAEMREEGQRGVEERSSSSSSSSSSAAVVKLAVEVKAAAPTLKAETVAATVATTSEQNEEDSTPVALNENDDEEKDSKEVKRKEKNVTKKRKLKEGEEKEKKKTKMHDEWTEKREMMETRHDAAAAAAAAGDEGHL